MLNQILLMVGTIIMHALVFGPNMNPPSDFARVGDAAFEVSELEVAHDGINHYGVENGQHADLAIDFARFDEAGFEEPELEVIAGGGNHHPALENEQNMNSQSDFASIDRPGFENSEMEVITEQENAHVFECGQIKNPKSYNCEA